MIPGDDPALHGAAANVLEARGHTESHHGVVRAVVRRGWLYVKCRCDAELAHQQTGHVERIKAPLPAGMEDTPENRERLAALTQRPGADGMLDVSDSPTPKKKKSKT